MKCLTDETIGAWLEKSLGGEERRTVTAHLVTCDDCRKVMAMAGTTERPAERAASRRWWPAVAGVAAAVILIAVVVSLLLPDPAPQDNPNTVNIENNTETARNTPDPKNSTVPDGETPAPESNKKNSNDALATVEPEEDPEETRTVPPKPAPDGVVTKDEMQPKELPVQPRPEQKPGHTVAEKIDRYQAVALLDVSGKLEIGEQPVSWGVRHSSDQKLVARSNVSFRVNGKMSMGLIEGSAISLALPKESDRYQVTLHSGIAFLDTSAASTDWTFVSAGREIRLDEVEGLLSIQVEKDIFKIRMIDGSAQWKSKGLGWKDEVQARPNKNTKMLSPLGGQAERQRLAWNDLRPKTVTLFSTRITAEGKSFFGYAIQERDARMTLRPSSEITIGSNCVLRFVCAQDIEGGTIVLSGYQTDLPAARKGDAVLLPLSKFKKDGVPLLTGDSLSELSLYGAEKNSVDVLQQSK